MGRTRAKQDFEATQQTIDSKSADVDQVRQQCKLTHLFHQT